MSPGEELPSTAEGEDEIAEAPTSELTPGAESPTDTGSATPPTPDAAPANTPAPGTPAEDAPAQAPGPEQRESLSESFNLEEIFQDILAQLSPLFDKFMEGLNTLLEELGIRTPEEEEGEQPSVPPAAARLVEAPENQQVLDALTILAGNKNNYFGGALSKTEEAYQAEAVSEISDLVGRGVTTLFSVRTTAEGNSSIQEFLDSELCASIDPKPTVLEVTIPKPTTAEEATQFWSNTENQTKFGELYQVFKTGNTAAIGENSSTESAVFSCIATAIDNPALNFEQVVDLVAPQLKQDAAFLEYRFLIESACENVELIATITGEDVQQTTERQRQLELEGIISGIGNSLTNAKINQLLEFIRANPTITVPEFRVNFRSAEDLNMPAGTFMKLSASTILTASGRSILQGSIQSLSSNLREGPSMSHPEVQHETLRRSGLSATIPRDMYVVAPTPLQIPRGCSLNGTISIGLVS